MLHRNAPVQAMTCASASMRWLFSALCILLLTVAGLAAPKNIILMIGDGMGPDSVAAARAYRFGAGRQKLAMEQLHIQLFATTFSANGAGYDAGWKNGDREYPKKGATDSAAAATALATGAKTYDAAIGVDLHKERLVNLVETAAFRGMKTGVVTTVQFDHATPAGFVAHNVSRNNYTQIGHEMLFDAKPDVIMGGGHPDGAPAGKEYEYITKDDWNAVQNGNSAYVLIQDRTQFRQLPIVPIDKKIFGLFRTHGNLKPRLADGSGADPALPTLAEMSKGALAVLDNPNGFFLMIEGGAIDWANHGNDLNGSIGETLGFDEAVASVVDWIEAHGGWKQNLLIITADHETGYLHSVKPTAAGKLPTVAWGTTDGKWGGHTNRPVPVYAQGEGAINLLNYVRSVKDFERGRIRCLDNTDIFRVMNQQLLMRPLVTPAAGIRTPLQPAPVR